LPALVVVVLLDGSRSSENVVLMLSSMAAVDGGFYPLSLEIDAFYL
jgi:hypothetical protein